VDAKKQNSLESAGAGAALSCNTKRFNPPYYTSVIALVSRLNSAYASNMR